MKLSVIICAYNPNQKIFDKVIASLKKQTLDQSLWELIVVDNNSTPPISSWLNLNWHSEAKIVVEHNQGLIFSRITGTKNAKYEFIASVDDDTPLFEDYLENILYIFKKYPKIGIIGGRSFPIYEVTPPAYIDQFKSFLAIRDLGEHQIIDQLTAGQKLTHYPSCSPILIAPKKECMVKYYNYFYKNNSSKDLGRKGDSLASGEDNDINLFIYKEGYEIGYFPELKFYHIIPKRRLTKVYLQKMAFESSRSWVKVLHLHQILPWKKISKFSYPFRCLKSFLFTRGFASKSNYIKWRGNCGTFKGLSELN